MTDNLIISSIKRLLKVLPKRYQLKALVQLGLMFLNSLVDIFGLAAILPLIAAILKEGFIQEQQQLNWLYTTFDFKTEQSFIIFICVLVVGAIVFKNLFSIWVGKFQTKFSWDINVFLSSKMFRASFLKGLNYYKNQNSNQIQNRIVRVPQLISLVIKSGFIQFINEVFILIIILVSIVLYEPQVIILLVVTIVPVFTLFYMINNKKIKTLQKKINDLNHQIIKPVYELSFGYVDVAISGVYKSFEKQFNEKLQEMKSKQIKVNVLDMIPSRLIEITVIITLILILFYGMFFLDSKESTISLIGVFGLAAYKAVPSLNRIMLAIVNVKAYEYAITEVENALDLDLIKSQANTKNKEVSFHKEVTIENLNYKFDDADTELLKNISLKITKGSIIGFVGRSGSGKTTLMNLLLGFLEPTKGQILVDGIPLPNNKEQWHKKLGYVRQDVFLIDGTIAENIAFGVDAKDIDYNKLREVVEIARLTAFIDAQEDGYETNVGERGSKISGGQKQRMGIARALYHDAEILFFDEATSALDEKTENEITESIKRLSDYQLTVVIIAHRLNTLKYCDHVYKVENASLTEV